MIEPVDPFQRGVFYGIQMPPRTATVNDLGFVEPDDGLGERVVVAVAGAAYDSSRSASTRRSVYFMDTDVLPRIPAVGKRGLACCRFRGRAVKLNGLRLVR